MADEPFPCPGCHRTDYEAHKPETAHMVGGPSAETRLSELRAQLASMADDIDGLFTFEHIDLADWIRAVARG